MFKKGLLSVFLAFVFVFLASSSIFAIEIKNPSFDISSKSAILMDANTGTVLYEKNINAPLPIASVTKIMTVLLIFEALSCNKISFTDMVTVSENAASMGGSQVYLEPGEELSVDDLLKCVIVSSANDAAVALAEHTYGSVELFVSEMNKKAKELNMKNSNFVNVTGLDDTATNHFSSAYDVAIMSKELLKHEKVTEYTTIWMDTIRDGEFGLSNTNKLVKYYKGITGLKTGSTEKAGFCLSASAKREGLHLIAVVLGSDSSSIRNQEVTKLLDFGFANYALVTLNGENLGKIQVYSGYEDYVSIKYETKEILINKGMENKITKEIELNDSISAPVYENDVIGKVVYKIDTKVICEIDILASKTVLKISFFEYIVKVIKNFF